MTQKEREEAAVVLERRARTIQGDSSNPLLMAAAKRFYERAARLRAQKETE